MTRFTCITLFAASAALAGPASATLIAYESFSYTGTLADGADIAGANGGTPAGSPGFNGSVWRDGNTGTAAEFVYEETGLTYTDGTNNLVTSGGATVDPDTSNPSLYFRNFDTPSGMLDTGNKVYFSFLSSSVGDGSRVFGLTTSDTNFGLRVYRINDGGTGRWQLQIGGTLDLADTSTTNNFNGLIVGRITMQDGADLTEIWINPDISSEASLGTADASVTANTPGFNRFRLEGGNFPTDLTFDELRIATTFAEAVPIPEPVSLALMGLGGLLILGRRREA